MTLDLLLAGRVLWLADELVTEDASLGVRDGLVAYVGPTSTAPSAARVLAGDWWLMPAYVDWHVHIAFGDPAEVLRNGVTRVRDLAWPLDTVLAWRDASLDPEATGPRIDCCGPMLTCPGGYCSQASWAPPGTAWEIEDVTAGTRAVDHLAERGVAAIKVALNSVAGPTLDDQLLTAICHAAHARGLEVTAHTEGVGQAERALRAGVDELAHCPWTEPLADWLVAALAERCRVVTTLDMLSHGRDTPELACGIENLRRLHAAGARIRYGTDLGSGPLPNGIHVGEVLHMGAAGMDAAEILSSLTLGPLAVGDDADIVGLTADPLQDIAALGEIAVVVRGGRVRRAPD